MITWGGEWQLGGRMVVDGNEKAANGQWYHQGELSEDEVERYRHPLKHPYLDGLERSILFLR